jgi:hypothetical protein
VIGSLALPNLVTRIAHAETNVQEHDTYLWAARTCYLEATWSKNDCVALLWVTRKRAARASRSWLDMLIDYSAVDANTPRAKAVRDFPWGDVPDKSETFNRRWRELRELVVDFADGKHPDPCPHAEHWGGKMDHPHGRMVKARCMVSTSNIFYAVRKR